MSNELKKLPGAVEQGEREAFEQYMLGREHPVIGWIDEHWFARGDDPTTYANDYVQGAWMMWQVRAAHPAPVVPVGLAADDVRAACQNAIEVFAEDEHTIQCWSCGTHRTLNEIRAADGYCPECEVEIDLAEYYPKLASAYAAMAAENERLRSTLKDQEAVLVNMLRGDIAIDREGNVMTDTINVPRELLERVALADPGLGTSAGRLIIAREAIAELRALLANPQPSQDMLMQSTSTDCRSDDGITVGLIDAVISIARVLRTRSFHAEAIQAAFADLRQDEDVRFLLANRVNQQPSQFEKPSLLTDTNVGYAADAGNIPQQQKDIPSA